jgi:hypothetical protein
MLSREDAERRDTVNKQTKKTGMLLHNSSPTQDCSVDVSMLELNPLNPTASIFRQHIKSGISLIALTPSSTSDAKG